MVPRSLKSMSCVFSLAIMIGLLFAGSYFHALEPFELDMLDLRFRIRPAIPATDQIAVIEIGDDTIKQLGRFPFDRSYHAMLIKALAESGAKAILFDIFFSEPDQSDQELEQAMHLAGNVYLPYVFELGDSRRHLVPEAKAYTANSLESFRELSKGTGHINVIPDSDGKFRRVPLFIQYQGRMCPYLSFLLGCDVLGISQKDVKLIEGKSLVCGSRLTIPLDENSNIIVNYPSGWGRSYRHYSYADVLRSYIAQMSGEQPPIDLKVFKNKICMIGLTAAGTTDLHPSPFESLYPALGIHADILNSMIQKNFITQVPWSANALILFLISLLTLGTVFRLKPLKGLFVLLGIISGFILAGVFLFTFWGLWIDIFYPVLAIIAIYLLCTFHKYVLEWKKRLLVENELQIAQRIQESFLPKALPKTQGIHVAAMMSAARQVGGDLYDFCEFSPDKLGVMIGDVSGKGIPASLFMSMASGAFRFFALPDVRPAETLHQLNAKLLRDSAAHLFVTMFYAIFDMNQKKMIYANGGHFPVLYLAKNSRHRFLDVEEGYPLGVLEGSYSGNEIHFSSEDIFVFFTDGVTEALDARGEMYGPERLAALVERNRACSAKELLNVIESDVRQFEPKPKQHDDMTVIVLKIL